MNGACEHPSQGGTPLRAVAAAFAVTASVFVVELVGGWWTGSLALISDAVHMGVDLVSLGLALFAAVIARRPPDAKRTFGYKRVEVLAALANGVALWVATGFILREAYERFVFPTPVAAAQMVGIALLGLVANAASAWILYAHSRGNLNVRGALLHVLSDGLGSLGALAAGAVMLNRHWYRADAVASVLICAGIVLSSYWLLRDSVHILLEGTPSHLDIDEIRQALEGLEGVREVHDLHLWSLSQGAESMSGHVVLEEGRDPHEVLEQGKALLKEKFDLTHVTLQVER